MYAKPIEERILKLWSTHNRKVVDLFVNGWTDKAIANYLASDRLTVHRVRKRFEAGELSMTQECQ